MNNKSQANNLYLILASIFVASLVSCNLIFQKFFEFEIWLPFIGSYIFQQSVGLLPYPITFLVTDIISEIYGMKKANQVVIAGLFASLFMLLVVSVSNYMTATSWSPVDGDTFNKVFGLSGAAVFASMMAYLFAQFIDVRIFHFWKNLTKGKHLWLRNNASTVFSQFVDTFLVLFLLCSLGAIDWDMFSTLLINGFLFKVFFAAFDTPFFYLCSWYLKKKYHLKDNEDLSNI
tara:strand:- start:747 stop:1442 length:696 start_codon:yes stop_codon:yes gene_type:complete